MNTTNYTKQSNSEREKSDSFYLRGELARSLSCWHRLSKDESDQLVNLFAEHVQRNDHPAPRPSGERAVLISLQRECVAELRETGRLVDDNGEVTNLIERIDDMLADDAQEMAALETRYFDLALSSIGAEWRAQQVAVPQALYSLIERWDKRSRDALPADAMLINKCIRELSTLLSAAPNQPQAGRVETASLVEVLEAAGWDSGFPPTKSDILNSLKALKALEPNDSDESELAQPAMKDHETAALVNRITAIAKEFGQTQQLRERIAHEIRPLHPAGATPTQNEQQQPTSTDVRNALLFALWHHQGASSKIGQPIRAALGIGMHAHLDEQQLEAARRVQDALLLQKTES